MRAFQAAGASLGLASCSAQQCDPSRAGFLDGIGCEMSRGYIARNQAQQSVLAQQNAAALTSRAQAQDEGARAGEARHGNGEKGRAQRAGGRSGHRTSPDGQAPGASAPGPGSM